MKYTYYNGASHMFKTTLEYFSQFFQDPLITSPPPPPPPPVTIIYNEKFSFQLCLSEQYKSIYAKRWMNIYVMILFKSLAARYIQLTPFTSDAPFKPLTSDSVCIFSFQPQVFRKQSIVFLHSELCNLNLWPSHEYHRSLHLQWWIIGLYM